MHSLTFQPHTPSPNITHMNTNTHTSQWLYTGKCGDKSGLTEFTKLPVMLTKCQCIPKFRWKHAELNVFLCCFQSYIKQLLLTYVYFYLTPNTLFPFCVMQLQTRTFMRDHTMPQATRHLPLTQKPGFDPKPAHVGLVVEKVALGDDFSPGISVSMSVSFHQWHTLIHTCFTTII
jgi:hypothetical protein